MGRMQAPFDGQPGELDVLSELLAICRSQRAVTARFSLRAPWALRSAGVSGAMIRMARGAPFWLLMPGRPPLQVAPGDLVMLPLGAAHTIASAPGVAAVPFSRMIQRHAVGPLDEHPLVFSHGGEGEATDLYSALVWFSAWCRHSVLALLPPLIHARAADEPLALSLAATMEALVRETLARRPGWRVAAARMGELLLIHLVRGHLAGLAATPAVGPGWLRGLGDASVARSLMAMHRAPAEAWTVERLAAEAGMSRSRFSDRFRERVGATPIGYLTSHRMALAAEQLEAGAQPLARIATLAGYDSDKVFSRAFKRWAGLTPTAWARRAREQRDALRGQAAGSAFA